METINKFRNSRWLHQKYWNEQLSTTQIAKICGIHHAIIHKWMKELRIPRRTISEAKRGIRCSEKTKRKISNSLSGNKNPMFGKHCSAETRRKISQSLMGEKHPQFGKTGKENPFFGKRHTAETKRKMSKSHAKYTGKKHPMFGKKHTLETKEKMGRAKRGQRLSEETKKKISDALSGRQFSQAARERLSESKKGKKNPMFGRHLSMEHKKKISEANSGENNPNWLNGKSFEPYSLEFNNVLRGIIRKRDDYKCQICHIKKNGRRHSVHHINYDKKDNNPKNLTTVCVACHAETNQNRSCWQAYFENMQ